MNVFGSCHEVAAFRWKLKYFFVKSYKPHFKNSEQRTGLMFELTNESICFRILHVAVCTICQLDGVSCDDMAHCGWVRRVHWETTARIHPPPEGAVSPAREDRELPNRRDSTTVQLRHVKAVPGQIRTGHLRKPPELFHCKVQVW